MVTINGDHVYFAENNSDEYLKILTDQLEQEEEKEEDSATKIASATAMLTLFTSIMLFLQ